MDLPTYLCVNVCSWKHPGLFHAYFSSTTIKVMMVVSCVQEPRAPATHLGKPLEGQASRYSQNLINGIQSPPTAVRYGLVLPEALRRRREDPKIANASGKMLLYRFVVAIILEDRGA
jgi:hypothetical protein